MVVMSVDENRAKNTEYLGVFPCKSVEGVDKRAVFEEKVEAYCGLEFIDDKKNSEILMCGQLLRTGKRAVCPKCQAESEKVLKIGEKRL